MKKILGALAVCQILISLMACVDLTGSDPEDVDHDLPILKAILIENNVPGADSFPRGFFKKDLSTGALTHLDLRGRGLSSFRVGPDPKLRLRLGILLDSNALTQVPEGVRFFTQAGVKGNRICDPAPSPDVVWMDTNHSNGSWRQVQDCP